MELGLNLSWLSDNRDRSRRLNSRQLYASVAAIEATRPAKVSGIDMVGLPAFEASLPLNG